MQHHQATTQIQTPQPPPRKNRNSSSHLGTHAVTLLEPDLVAPEEEDDDAQFVVVTFYKFVALEDPRAEVASHLHFLQGWDIHGRIYLNEQGINAQVVLQPNRFLSDLTSMYERSTEKGSVWVTMKQLQGEQEGSNCRFSWRLVGRIILLLVESGGLSPSPLENKDLYELARNQRKEWQNNKEEGVVF